MAPVTADLLAFVMANLPPPPARILEVGAGDGSLARALGDGGYDVVAIDPEPVGPNVLPVTLEQLSAPEGSFAAAVAVTSLHHIEPLDSSIHHLAQLIACQGTLVVDELDIDAYDERAAEWWLRQRQSIGITESASSDELVRDLREHLHPLSVILATLAPLFESTAPVRGPYLYRWSLHEAFRADEERAIGRGAIPAVGARFVARRIG